MKFFIIVILFLSLFSFSQEIEEEAIDLDLFDIEVSDQVDPNKSEITINKKKQFVPPERGETLSPLSTSMFKRAILSVPLLLLIVLLILNLKNRKN